MGKLGKALLTGVGVGLSTLAQGMQLEMQQEREDKRLAKLDDFKERDLTIREEESKINKQRLDIANRQALAKYNHGRYVQLAASSEYDPAVMDKANTDLINNGLVYRNNTIEASKLQMKSAKDGRFEMVKPYAVWDIGTYNTDKKTGEPITDDNGNPEYIPHKTGNGRQIFWTRDEFITSIDRSANADEFSKYAFVEMNAEKQRGIDAANVKSKAAAEFATKKGQTDEALSRQKISESKAREAKLRAEAKSGGGKGLKNIAAMASKELAASLRKDFPGEPITPETADKMASIRENPKTRRIFRKAAEAALDPGNPATMSDFIDGGTSRGIPRAFMEKLYEEAEIAYEERGEEAFASDGWFTKMYNNVVNYLSGSKE
jgi:hypothetical protein